MRKSQTKQVEISICAVEELARPFFTKVGKLFNEAKKYKVVVNISRGDLWLLHEIVSSLLEEIDESIKESIEGETKWA